MSPPYPGPPPALLTCPPHRVLSSPASHPRGRPGLPDASRAPALRPHPPQPPAKACYTQCWHDLEAGLRVGSGEPAACSFSCRPASGPASSPLQGVEVGVTGRVSSPISRKSAPSQILNVPWLETSSVLLLFVLSGREWCNPTSGQNKDSGSFGGQGAHPSHSCGPHPQVSPPGPEPHPPQLNPKPSAVRLISSGLEGSCCPCC